MPHVTQPSPRPVSSSAPRAFSCRAGKGPLAAACLLAAALAGCSTTSPANYAATLSPQDPKWQSPECVEMRTRAATYAASEKQTIDWGTGLMFGPYGLGMALAGKQHQEKQRKLFARDLHLRCSSQPLPSNLQVDTASARP